MLLLHDFRVIVLLIGNFNVPFMFYFLVLVCEDELHLNLIFLFVLGGLLYYSSFACFLILGIKIHLHSNLIPILQHLSLSLNVTNWLQLVYFSWSFSSVLILYQVWCFPSLIFYEFCWISSYWYHFSVFLWFLMVLTCIFIDLLSAM